ncbi:MAG: hypothetical protein K6A67_09560 [Bacteroidales bacterium]|nr:hypothetical protein [Bacteroidales bacterium]
MKNIFKFMGLALIAGSLMFTACKKDDDTNTNNDTTNNNQEETIPDGVKVTFGTDSWTPVDASYCYTFYSAGMGLMSEYYKGNTYADSYEFITTQTEVGTESATLSEQTYSFPQSSKIITCEYSKQGLIYFPSEIEEDPETGELDTTFYRDHWAYEANFNIKALDADNLTVSAILTAKMFNTSDVFVQGGVAPSQANLVDMKVTLGNVQMVTMK